jgi:hypothetical protein
MAAHDGELGSGQRPRLEHQFIWNRNLAEVVQQGALLDDAQCRLADSK